MNLQRKILDYFGHIMTTFGAVFGFLGVYLVIKSDVPSDQVFSLLIKILIVTSGFFLLLFLIFLKKYLISRRYIATYKIINNAFVPIDKISENPRIRNDLKSCIKEFQDFCTCVSNAFTTISNRSCYVCIKIFEEGNAKEVHLITFCRDTDSRLSAERVDPEDDNTIHYLKDNTDFNSIFENIVNDGEKSKYFFSNNLVGEKNYMNTRIKDDTWEPKTKIPIIRYVLRNRKWPLPYRSVITVPISPLSNRRILHGQLIGYLCVDAPYRWSFRKRIDIEIIRGIAAGIYLPLKSISEIHFNSIHTRINPRTKKYKTLPK